MKFKLIEITLFIIILSGCGILSKSIEQATESFVNIIVPDTCEIQLIEKIATYRRDSMKIPDHNNALNMIKSQSRKCQESFDSVRIIPLSADSIDLIITKKVHLQETTALTTRNYRIIFHNDSIKRITGSIMTNNPTIDHKPSTNKQK